MRKLYVVILSGLLFSFLKTHAQESNKLISGNFNTVNPEQFIKQLAAKINYHFYYNPHELDSLIINFSADRQPLDSVLKQALQNTPFHFAIDEENRNVFITKGFEIRTELPATLFGEEGKPKPAAASNIAVLHNAPEKQKPLVMSVADNRLHIIGTKSGSMAGNATIAGYIRSSKSDEPLTGVIISADNTKIATVSDQYGYYSLTLPKGRYSLSIKGIGIRDAKRQIILYSDGKLNINAQEQLLTLREVVISSEKASNINRTQMGVERLSMETIKQVPTVFGEADVLKVVLTLPGVKSVGEASAGFNVRGGSTDQNLILFNDATIYNPTHFFGFFSAFNPDVVKDVELYKSSIPAKYGGRLSSVLEVNSKEGNKKDFTGTAGIGLLTSRLNVEGPIVKDKTSFVLGGRTTYSNWILNLLPDNSGYKSAKASFYDINLDISHQINEKNNLYFTGYFSHDKSNLASDTSYAYNNRNLSLKWKHVFNNKLYGVFIAGEDRYEYQNYSESNDVNAYRLAFDINQTNVKANFSYYLNPKHSISFGLSSILYKLHPGSFSPLGSKSLIMQDVVPAEQGLESALYAGDEYKLTKNISLNFGVRYSLFNNLGPQTVNTYAPNVPKTEDNIIDSVHYNKDQVIKTYGGPEIRFSGRFAVSDDFSVKAGYNTLRQYIHMLSNTTAISPTDIWKLSDANIRPQYGDQVSLGFYKNFKSNTIETSVEGYYKRLKDYLDYKNGAVLVLNHTIEQDVINTKGKAYGVEFMVKKLTGKLNGWMSYTYSRTFLKMDDPNAGELINEGNYYPSNFDQPHNFTLIGNYKFSHRFSLSFNATYSTGRPITLPIAKFYYDDSERVLYSDRNEYRIPDYFRTDLSMNIEGNHKVHQLTHNSWTIGIYNLTGRKNAYSTYFTSENGRVNGYKLSIFGSAIPFINYNIRF